MAKIQQDILGNTPKVGDTIVFNPSLYKGIVRIFKSWFAGNKTRQIRLLR